jgi:TonB family protein
MLRPNRLLTNIIVFPVGLTLFPAATSQVPEAVRTSPTSAVDSIRAPLALEWDRAIVVLKRGLKEHWATRDQYLAAFEKTPGTNLSGRREANAKSYVECEIGEHLTTHGVWDEKWNDESPINVEVQRAIDEFTARQEGQFVGFLSGSCAAPAPKKVIVSAGVAASMLKTKIDPVYPPRAGSFPTAGTVVLHATISTRGTVEALTIVSGPAFLQHAALDAVRHWTYRPYLLNNAPVEVETTISVIFLRPNP